MARITNEIDKNKDLTTFTAEGKLSAEQFIDIAREFYQGDYTSHLLWDFSRADLTGLSREHVNRLAEVAKCQSHKRTGCRTAFVVTDDFHYGLGRMFEIFSEIRESHLTYRAFKDRDEAVLWLTSDDA